MSIQGKWSFFVKILIPNPKEMVVVKINQNHHHPTPSRSCFLLLAETILPGLTVTRLITTTVVVHKKSVLLHRQAPRRVILLSYHQHPQVQIQRYVSLPYILFVESDLYVTNFSSFTARANGTTTFDTHRDQRSVAIDEEAAIANYELTLKCGGKRLIKSGHDKFFVRKPKYRPYLLVLKFMNDPKMTGTNIACLQCKKKGPCSSIVEIQPTN